MADALPPPEILSTSLGADWVSLNPKTPTDPADVDAAKQVRAKAERQLADVLLSENLIVLTGLGTSLCVKDAAGKSLAPGMGDLWKEAEKLTKDNLKSVADAVSFDLAKPNIESLLSRCQLAQQLKPNADIAAFVENAERMIVAKCRFVNSSLPLDTHEAFLRRVARRSTRLPRVKLFTTNYDLCFEQAASRTRFVVIDGFSHTQPQEFDGGYFSYDMVRRHQDREIPDFIPNVFHLYKIHGSVDWAASDGQIVRDDKAEHPLLIFPRESKFQLSYDQPFLEMMARLQMALRQPNTGLLVVGFGFNDHHISQPLISAVRANVSLKVSVVDPFLKTSTNPIHTEMVSLIKKGDSRLSLFAMTFESVLPLIPNLVAQTEEEQHRGRLTGRGGTHA